MFWYDEEPQKKQYAVEWRHENEDGVLEDVEFVWAYSTDEAMEKFWAVQDRDDEIPDDAQVVSVKIA